MKRSRGILLAACALVVAASLLLWWTWRGEPSVAPPGPEPSTNAPAVAASEPQAPPDPVVEPARTVALDPTAHAAAPAVPELLWIDLRVVDAASSEPVADAEVFWNDAASDRHVQQLPKAEAQRYERDPEQKARRFGRRARSDRDGRLRIAMELRGGRIYATAGDRFGERFVSAATQVPSEGHVLRLEREERLVVRLDDARGRPVATVPIGLAVRTEGSAPEGRIVLRDTTDAAGLVRFAHLQQLRTVGSGPDKGKTVVAFVVHVLAPGLAVEPFAVDATAPLPNEPIALRLSATGSLRLRFLLGEEPFPGVTAATVHLGPLGEGDARGRRVEASVGAGGFASFGSLPLDTPLFVRPSGPKVDVAGWSELPRLTEPGEASHDVDLARDAVVLRGRLLDASGTPLADQRFELEYATNRGGGTGRGSTDAQGGFVYFLSRSGGAPLQLLRGRLQVAASGVDLAAPPRWLQLGVNEFGDVACLGHPLLVAGRIEGDPVALDTVRLQVERGHVGRPGELHWREFPLPSRSVGADGRFELRATVEPGRYRLLASAPGMVPLEPIEFVVGANDLVVPMRTAHQLAASCWLPEDAPRSSVSLELAGGPVSAAQLPGGNAGRAPSAILGNSLVAPGGRVDTFWSDVERGTYSLVVRLLGVAEPLLVIEDVAVPGPKGGDARLGSIDLRPMLQVVTLRVFDRAGRPFQDGPLHGLPRDSYVVLDSQPHEASSVFEVLTRDLRLLVPRSVSSVWFATLGFRPQWVPLTGANPIDVRLEAWPRVALRLAPGTVLPEGCELVVRSSAERAPVARRAEVVPGGGFTGRRFALGDLLQPAADPAVLRQADQETLLEVDQWAPELQLRRGDRTYALLRSVLSDWPEARTGRGVTIAPDRDELVAAAAALGVGAAK